VARARVRSGDPAAGEAALDRALEVNPGFVEARCERAVLYGACGRGADADREWRAVLRLDPLHPLARAHAGEVALEAMEEGYSG
jgi:Tfp pilus assembly protein PilF